MEKSKYRNKLVKLKDKTHKYNIRLYNYENKNNMFKNE